MSLEERRAHRVLGSHRIALTAFRAGGGFAMVAAAWSVWILVDGGSWWGPLHAFVAGTVLLAISGATQMFTVTWAAAPAPPAALANGQRRSLAFGVLTVLAGITTGAAVAVWVGVTLTLAGLALLAYTLWGAVRASLLRRFDLSARFYLLALSGGLVGVTLGGVIGSGVAPEQFARFRAVHSHLNLVVLVGLVIVGTLPTILPTFAHHRAVSGREALVAWWLAVGAAVLITSGIFLGEVPVGMGTLLAGASLATLLSGIVFRLGRRGLNGGLPYLQVTAGSVWLVIWAVVDAARWVSGSLPPPFSAWTAAVVTAGVGQILLGSLAYLLPVLSGPPPRLGHNLARTHGRRWLPLALANVAGVCFVTGASTAGAVLVGLWALDFAVRVARMEWGQTVTDD